MENKTKKCFFLDEITAEDLSEYVKRGFLPLQITSEGTLVWNFEAGENERDI